MRNKTPVVFLACTGLGRINRGYESFSRECFNALKDESSFTMYLLKGGGENAKQEITIPNIYRRSFLAKFVNKLFGIEEYITEQFTFFLSLIPLIILKKPSIFYYSDFILGTYLWNLRDKFKFKYKLLFTNGASYEPPFSRMDHVQQLLPLNVDLAKKKGCSEEMQTVLPLGFNINVDERLNELNNRDNARKQLGITDDQKIVLSVCAVNKQKRVSYLIKEIEKLPINYFLIVLGQVENESNEIINLANEKIPGRYSFKNVPMEEVKYFYLAADYFVLAAIKEGFGRVIIEAMSYGLTCIVHDNLHFRQLCGKNANYINMEEEGALFNLLISNNFYIDRNAQILGSFQAYSWEVLKQKYIEMILSIIKS